MSMISLKIFKTNFLDLILTNQGALKNMNKNITIAQKSNINKILVVGHEKSEYRSVLELLNAGGMRLADASERNGIEADEISKIILKNFQDTGLYEQLEVSPVWNGLALELMMANLDKSPWCWADSESISLLNYWRKLDNQLAFIFVYDNPREFILKSFAKSKSFCEEALRLKLDEWYGYNRALLDFYNRNKECCLLVNSEQITQNATGYLEYVESQIGIPLLTNISEHINLETTALVHGEQKTDNHQGMYGYLAHDLLLDFPYVIELYEELESMANLPAFQTVEKANKSRYEAWRSLSNFQSTTELMLQQKNKDLELSEEQNKKNEQVLKEKAEQLQKQYTESKNLTEENELLLTQLHHVQEELEEVYLSNEKTLKEKNAEIQKRVDENKQLEQTLKQKTEQLQKAEEQNKKNEQTLKQKAEQLQQQQAQSKNLTEENELLLTQLHLVQEELEAIYLKNIAKKEEKQRIYGAAEHVKSDLSYRLGAQMIANSKTFGGWLRMPFTLASEAKAFKEERAKNGGKKFPPLHQYADAHEAERVKKHLSYMLGQTMVENSKTLKGRLTMPFALKKAHKAYKQGRRS